MSTTPDDAVGKDEPVDQPGHAHDGAPDPQRPHPRDADQAAANLAAANLAAANLAAADVTTNGFAAGETAIGSTALGDPAPGDPALGDPTPGDPRQDGPGWEEAMLGRTRDAYDAVADLYADMFSGSLAHRPLERAMFGAFAELVAEHSAATGSPGVVADVGCGPGHITAHLHSLDVAAVGVDLSTAMIDRARRDYPGLTFEVGLMHRLEFGAQTLSGIVAWYSMIHLPPGTVPRLFAEFRRVLAPGGQLLLAFQTTEVADTGPQPHAHRVAPSHRWPPDRVALLLRRAGFVETARLLRDADEVDTLPSAVLLARARP
ncbi:class I SAM-dependent methyltransferase [Frankia sp. AiPa1]|uniref:class I SAM-dependent methyltransferase n=1 Tax=Frankia sp. AiPa1 TaxID=573492 RepID=UPI00202AE8CE|nr:class I SAM-dependent methyltransferase [Frankia sp. AiPa1]MCL9758822.1 methyltransferase domain-containing protein [Frankia sp. AiPa1]